MAIIDPQIQAHYIHLQNRVSEFFSAVILKHSKQMKCANGCYNCCANGLTVSPIEAHSILDFLKASDERLALIEQLQVETRIETSTASSSVARASV